MTPNGRDMAETGKSKIRVWRWQARFLEAGVEGLPSGMTRPSGIPLTSAEQVAEIVRLTRRRLQRGVFRSLVDLQAAINRFIAGHSEREAKPSRWTADPDRIIAARNR